MARMPDNFVDLTVTSPPYDSVRSYNSKIDKTWNKEVWQQIIKSLYRVTKTGGIVVWVVNDQSVDNSETGTSFEQALYFKEVGFKIYDTMIYGKNNPQPKNHRRYEQAFEFMFVLSKGIPNTFNPVMVPCKYAGKPNKGTKRDVEGNLHKYTSYGKSSADFKIDANIWMFNIGWKQSYKEPYLKGHPAIFPEQLAEKHITTWTNEKDLVYDPFMGSGTVAKMALLNGRNYIGSELNPDYCKIIERRINAAKQDIRYIVNS